MNQQTCPQHGQPYLKLCIDEKCSQQSFLCSECYKTHQCQKFDIPIGIEEFAFKLNVNLNQLDKINLQFKELDIDSFGSFIKTQKNKINEDFNLIRQALMKKIDYYEQQIVYSLEEQISQYQKNINLVKNNLKETEKFKSLTKSSSPDMLKLKLSNQDPNNVIKKLKNELVNYHIFMNQNKIDILKEQLIVLQSQTTYPPTYRSVEFNKNEFQGIQYKFDDQINEIKKLIIQYIKQFPITDLEQRNIHQQKYNKQTKILEEDNCVTALKIFYDQQLLFYALNDNNVKITNFKLEEIDLISCHMQINVFQEIPLDDLNQQNIQNQQQQQDHLGEQQQQSYKIIGKNVYPQQIQLALGSDDQILLWSVQQQQLCQHGIIKSDKMNRCIAMIYKDGYLICGDWEGQILIWNLSNINQILYIETQTSILFQLDFCKKYLISGSKCDMEQGGVIFWNFVKNDCYIQKRLNIQSILRMHLFNNELYIIDHKYQLYIYECDQIQLIRQFLCSESFVNEISLDDQKQIYILNQTSLKLINNKKNKVYFYEDFPCSQCRQLYQSKKIYTKNNIIVFIRHFHQCRHESGDNDKCQLKSIIYIIK